MRPEHRHLARPGDLRTEQVKRGDKHGECRGGQHTDFPITVGYRSTTEHLDLIRQLRIVLLRLQDLILKLPVKLVHERTDQPGKRVLDVGPSAGVRMEKRGLQYCGRIVLCSQVRDRNVGVRSHAAGL